ncbi:MAG: hypothetical protein JRH16_03335 [Deltaproteobacteria bacterium]|nr:hypothetical protein [Deltaproteobacteria bacterium]MBW2360199.1 hypothetical protein [Deltaproteobacteria bacterium]
MDLESMKQFELDVRMLRRRGWIEQDELEKRLAELPDVADKAAPVEAEPPSGEL